MSPMDHAEAHERIADLALEPAWLANLGEPGTAEQRALGEHTSSCGRCRAELAEWRKLHTVLGDALPAERREQLEPILPPVDVRVRVLAAATAEPGASRPVAAVPLRRRLGMPSVRAMLAAAASVALIAALVAAALVRDQSTRLDQSTLERMWLADTVSAMSRILATPDHHLVSLRTADGMAGGTIAWSQRDLVVLSRSLPAPAAGQIYRCWLNYEGDEIAVGRMWFVNGNAFWAASTADWAMIDFDPEKHFLVSLESSPEPGSHHSGPVLLEASLGG